MKNNSSDLEFSLLLQVPIHTDKKLLKQATPAKKIIHTMEEKILLETK